MLWWLNIVGGRPYPIFGGNTNSSIQDFIDFAVEPFWNLIFSYKTHNYPLFSPMILVYASWFWAETAVETATNPTKILYIQTYNVFDPDYNKNYDVDDIVSQNKSAAVQREQSSVLVNLTRSGNLPLCLTSRSGFSWGRGSVHRGVVIACMLLWYWVIEVPLEYKQKPVAAGASFVSIVRCLRSCDHVCCTSAMLVHACFAWCSILYAPYYSRL